MWCCSVGRYTHTLPKFNSSPLKSYQNPIGKACLPTTIFQGLCSTSGGYMTRVGSKSYTTASSHSQSQRPKTNPTGTLNQKMSFCENIRNTWRFQTTMTNNPTIPPRFCWFKKSKMHIPRKPPRSLGPSFWSSQQIEFIFICQGFKP